ncbi:hypothetical protein [Brucella abortus]|uniref:hypothetical protein n=1 Tax=Brucella abortus TaxID=235 RepID=UPI00283A9249|nr:hypothetical protein [Brucella abortus]
MIVAMKNPRLVGRFNDNHGLLSSPDENFDFDNVERARWLSTRAEIKSEYKIAGAGYRNACGRSDFAFGKCSQTSMELLLARFCQNTIASHGEFE